MGRETTTMCHWQGRSARVKVLLESTELILRGELRSRIPRSTIAQESVAATAEGFTLLAAGDRLTVELPGAEAARWVEALLTPPPDLRHKLGVGATQPAWVLRPFDDEALARALDGATVPTPAGATVIVAVLEAEEDLDALLAAAGEHPTLPLWCVYRKGPQSVVGDATVRTRLRTAGYVDAKSCAVSDRLTATRYRPR